MGLIFGFIQALNQFEARMKRRQMFAAGFLGLFLGLLLATTSGAQSSGRDPYDSGVWPDMERQFLGLKAGSTPVAHDTRVQVQVPAFAEDPMNVPVSVRVDASLGPVQRVVVLVDRNPIRQVLSFEPVDALPAIALRFKLEQASPVRAAVLLRSGRWHVGSAWVDSAGGGCTVSGATRKDGTWSQTLGEVSGKLFDKPQQGTRLRVQLMHPMDTGLVGGVPAFYVNKLSLRDGADHELARLQTYEPVSENPVFSFDFAVQPKGGVRIVGTDNNGNRINGRVQ
jgi:sulfur-oxidizing protein SoxY